MFHEVYEALAILRKYDEIYTLLYMLLWKHGQNTLGGRRAVMYRILRWGGVPNCHGSSLHMMLELVVDGQELRI